MKRICVFCGSKPGIRAVYAEQAKVLGRLLVKEGIELVYGGGRVGLMTEIADAVLAEGGHVIGVIPQALVEMEVAHQGLPDIRVVHSMHERKALMAELSDGFIAMPGGFGTLEELFEVITWAQLGFHPKPCGILNVDGYYDPLIRFIDSCVHEQFLRAEHRHMLLSSDNPHKLLSEMRAYMSPDVPRILKKQEL